MLMTMKSTGLWLVLKKEKENSEIWLYLPKSKYAKLWFYLGPYLYTFLTMSVRNVSCYGPQSQKFEKQFLSIHLEGQLAFPGVKVGFLWPKMNLEQPDNENGMCYCHGPLLKHRDVSAGSKAVPVTTIATVCQYSILNNIGQVVWNQRQRGMIMKGRIALIVWKLSAHAQVFWEKALPQCS